MLCLLAPLGSRTPLWLAMCAAPLWCAAVLSGHWLALPLLIAAAVMLARPGLGPVLLAVCVIEALRAWLLQPLVPRMDSVAPLLLGGVVLAGLASGTPAGRVPTTALLIAGLGLGGGALRSLQGPLDSHSDISAAADWGVLTARDPGDVGDVRWALRESPRWHAIAAQLPVEEALGLGWQSERAALPAPERVAAARWLEARRRGGEALRLLRRGADPQSRWWFVYFARVSGRNPTFVPGEWSPEEARAFPLEAIEFPTNRTDTIVLSVDTLVQEVEIIASAEWFEGPPTLIVALDDATFRLQPTRSPRRFRISKPLQPGPHRLTLRYETDRYVSGRGDRNVYVHAIRALSP